MPPSSPASPSLRGVLWDFGGVLTNSPFEAFAAYEARQGLPDRFLRTVNATNPDTNAWAQLERAEISVEAFDQAFAAESEALGYRVPGQDVLLLLAGERRPQMIDAVRQCRAQGLVTALLTNNVRSKAKGSWAHGLHLDELFDTVVESALEGVRKPDPAAYQLTLDRMGLAPHQVVFLDDLGINLKPARAMGMQTIKVSDPDVALAELEGLLGVTFR